MVAAEKPFAELQCPCAQQPMSPCTTQSTFGGNANGNDNLVPPKPCTTAGFTKIIIIIMTFWHGMSSQRHGFGVPEIVSFFYSIYWK